MNPEEVVRHDFQFKCNMEVLKDGWDIHQIISWNDDKYHSYSKHEWSHYREIIFNES